MNTENCTLKIEDITSLDNFVKKGEYVAFHDTIPIPILRDEKALFADIDGILVDCEEHLGYDRRMSLIIELENFQNFIKDTRIDKFRNWGGVLIQSIKGKNDWIIIRNADENYVDVAPNEGPGRISVSFICISQLLWKSNEDMALLEVAKQLANGNIQILDYEADEIKSVTQKIRSEWIAFKKKCIYNEIDVNFQLFAEKCKKPSGFNLIQTDLGRMKFHKSPKILLKHKGKSYFLGQDEETYFGCELADNPKTIKEALVSLAPLKARNKKGVLRQGEWFLIPHKPPEEHECLATAYCIVLPLDDPMSNQHELQGNIRISENGVFVHSVILQHPEHETIQCVNDKWYLIQKNTAIRSVSVDGVD